ncbi:MAG: hypothetical protein Q3979_06160 [Actinomycetaceae bacterium]|nr:hypothetical protein [Actinomycetaceae bacterium]
MKRTIPYFATGVLLGILVAFWVWAIHWVNEDYSETRLGLEESTTLDLRPTGPPPEESSGAYTRFAQRLRALAEEEDIAIAYIADEGHPEIIAVDPHGHIPWLARDAVPGTAYPIAGTYTAGFTDGQPPLIPDEYSVGRPISGIPGIPSNIQYVRLLDDSPARVNSLLPNGTCILTTRDTEVIAKFQNIVGSTNMGAFTDNHQPLITYILQNPLFVATSALLAAGLASAMIYWAMRTRQGRGPDVRWTSGATAARLWRRELRTRLPALGLGLVLGACLDGLAIFAVRTSWSRELSVFSALGAGAAVAIVCTAYAVLTRIATSAHVRRLERA